MLAQIQVVFGIYPWCIFSGFYCYTCILSRPLSFSCLHKLPV